MIRVIGHGGSHRFQIRSGWHYNVRTEMDPERLEDT